MPAEEIINNAFYEGDFCALIVGISTYKYGFSSEEKADPQKFPNLRWAHKDASDFRDFLLNHGGVEQSVHCLLNEEATNENIKSGFGKLRKFCKSVNNPLVFIFFAGHGWREEECDYLVPYDGKKDDLYGTCIKSDEFTRLLGDVKTERLVVFIDACHSGAVELNARGEADQFDPILLGEGTGRFVIASCATGQQSYEIENNGIFTRNLLELLNFEGPEVENLDTITTHLLYPYLQEKVTTMAQSKLGKEQKPSYDGRGEGIILNVNVKLRQRQKEREEEDSDQKIRMAFKEMIDTILEKNKFGSKSIFRSALNNAVKKKDQPIYGEFNNLFNEFYPIWWAMKDEQLAQTAYEDLANCLTERLLPKNTSCSPPSPSATKTPSQAAASPQAEAGVHERESAPSQAASNQMEADTKIEKEPSYQFVKPDTKAFATESFSQRYDSLQGTVSPMRKMKEHAEYILAEIKLPKYYDEYVSLSDSLNNASISESQFMDVLNAIRGQLKEEKDAMDKLRIIAKRFAERWERADKVETKTTMDLKLKR